MKEIMSSECNDCGSSDNSRSEGRSDICVECWDLRGRFMSAARSGKIQSQEFKEVQRALSGRSHNGANAMRQALGEISI